MISAVIPACNAAAWLPAALESVHAQTLAPDEIIVVDNNSIDDSGALAAALGARVLHESQPGAAAARNRGIEAAEGEWIALLDADDYWLPGKLEQQWSLVQRFTDLRLVTTNYLFDRDGTLGGPAFEQSGHAYRRLPKRALTDNAARVTVDDLSEQLAAGNAWLGLNSSAVFFRKEDALAIGGFDSTFRRLEDMEFFARLLRRVDSVAFVETPLAAYRWHGANSSHDRLQMAESHIRMREGMIAAPSRYVRHADRWARATLPRWYRQLALARMQSGNRRAARGALRTSWGLEPNWRTAVMWIRSWMDF